MHTEVVDWLTIHFLPHEAELRRMLRRVCIGPAEVDDVVQETCYRILSMPSLDHVRDPKPFVFRAAKNIVLDRIKRDNVVHIEALANLEELDIADTAPSPERVVFARSELEWVIGLVANLPDRCKSVFRARRIHGLSQQETAETLGLTGGVVEHEMMKGMRLMSEMIAQYGMQQEAVVSNFIPGKRPAKRINAKD
ncbi:RNA polymerase sigma factor [Pseudoduganella aquatica]|uniref:Sigma-70 family RNA polymerase sigma factor n=1 Tax=Pseudoduganella aquatica TaxID=2660641 RepID=A0A7X4H8T3_9BURK|nr:RNA polymerase sigma factor [Pseudoduganella aquatica]MYN06780.1 sigma-70 family RNA polymerase sigma factor [Pseudoduganella aquatica]